VQVILSTDISTCDWVCQDPGRGSTLGACLRQGVSGFSTAGSKFVSIVRRARMVSTRDNGI
jgi:hypothetical protein